MAQLAPFGFQAGQSRRSVNEYYVAASDTSTLAVGDPVRADGNVFVGRLPDSRVSHGMLHVTKAASGQAVRGVIVGIAAGPDANNLQSLPATKTRPYCVLVNDNPQVLWDVQADNAAPLSAMAGMYASYAVGSPLGSVSSTVVDADSIGSTVSDLLIAEVLRNDSSNSLLRVAFVQHEMAAAGGSPQIGAAVQALGSGDGSLPTNTNLADAARLTSVRGTPQSTQSATSTTAVVALTPTAVANACRLAWVDLKPPKGSTTDAAGYAVGVKTINLASAGTGTWYAGDVVTFSGQSNEYTLLAGDSDVSNGGTITLAGYGLFVAIASSATAITLVRRGPMLRVALNCDNDVEGLLACNTPSSQDASVRLGETVMLRSDVTITQVHASANVSVLANNHRIEATFGV